MTQVMYSWLLGLIVFFLLAPVQASPRYFMPALVPLTFLVARFCSEAQARLFEHAPKPAALLPFVVCLVISLTTKQHLPPGVRGLSAAAQSIPVRRDLVTLVSADSFGEGAFIVERLMSDRDRKGIVLRASKLLATSDWHGEYYKPLVAAPIDVVQLLQELPVHYVVVINNPSMDRKLSTDRKILQNAIEHHPSIFNLTGRFPLFSGINEYDEAITIYENTSARNLSANTIRVPLSHTLRRTLSLELGSGKGSKVAAEVGEGALDE